MSIHGKRGAVYKIDLAQLKTPASSKTVKQVRTLALLIWLSSRNAWLKVVVLYLMHPLLAISVPPCLLPPTSKPLFTTLAANAHVAGKSIIILLLNDKAYNAAIKSNISCQHEAMITAHAKA